MQKQARFELFLHPIHFCIGCKDSFYFCKFFGFYFLVKVEYNQSNGGARWFWLTFIPFGDSYGYASLLLTLQLLLLVCLICWWKTGRDSNISNLNDKAATLRSPPRQRRFPCRTGLEIIPVLSSARNTSTSHMPPLLDNNTSS